jgi:hypothetical protein
MKSDTRTPGFIRLRGHGDYCSGEFFLAVRFITMVSKMDDKSGTLIYTNDQDEPYGVVETPEQVMSLIREAGQSYLGVPVELDGELPPVGPDGYMHFPADNEPGPSLGDTRRDRPVPTVEEEVVAWLGRNNCPGYARVVRDLAKAIDDTSNALMRHKLRCTGKSLAELVEDALVAYDQARDALALASARAGQLALDLGASQRQHAICDRELDIAKAELEVCRKEWQAQMLKSAAECSVMSHELGRYKAVAGAATRLVTEYSWADLEGNCWRIENSNCELVSVVKTGVADAVAEMRRLDKAGKPQ